MRNHLLFDLDGTLVDSAPDIHEAMCTAFRREGLEPPAAAATLAGVHLPLPGLVAALAPGRPDRHEALAAAFRAAYDQGGFPRTAPYPGAVETLGALVRAGFVLHLVTNKRRVPTELFVARFGLGPHFASVVTNTDLAPGEGKAEAITGLLSRLGVAPTAALYLGDTEADLVASRRAGVEMIWVPWGYGRPDSHAPGVFAVPADFATLRELLGA